MAFRYPKSNKKKQISLKNAINLFFVRLSASSLESPIIFESSHIHDLRNLNNNVISDRSDKADGLDGSDGSNGSNAKNKAKIKICTATKKRHILLHQNNIKY